ncbi:Lrp/AsnC family transcriptional regulator [Candidatus Bathyarchaeota archaeon]|nr:MAG: Lrp/AsnC family transcriptional regulator [Candidatus Bathyarchaeota archaeon]
MDEIDLKILKILKQNSRAKYVRIAESVGLTEGAVRRRIRALTATGIIKRFTVETAAEFEGIVLVETMPTTTKNITSTIEKIATRVFEVSGDYDVAALIQAFTMDELNRKIDEIRKLPGVQNTNTLIKLTD